MKNVRVGLIGSGFGARVTLPCFHKAEGIDVVAFASRDPEKINAVAGQYKIKHICGSLDEMVQLSDLDMVCVETPPYLHKTMVQKVLNAGKHVLCEKPMALNFIEAQEMFDLSQQKGTSLCVIGHRLRFQMNLSKIKDLIDEGKLGEIHHVDLKYFTASRHDASIGWNWWSDAQAGGGQLNALGSHFIDLLRWWLGEVETVQGHFGTFHNQRLFDQTSEMREVTSDEYAAFDLFFDHNVWASARISSVVCDESGIEIHVVGSNGSLVLDRSDQLNFYADKNEPQDITADDPLLEESIVGVNQWRTSLVRYAEHIAATISEKKYFQGATFYDGVKTQEILDAVRLSHQESRQVKIKEIRELSGVEC